MLTVVDDVTKQERARAVSQEAALDWMGGDLDLLREIIAIFLDEYPKLLADIRSAVATGNAAQLETAAHSLKGCVANFGADHATQAAYNLEKAGRQRQMQGTRSLLEVLERELEGLHPTLASWMA